jgi:hypothetical protein
MKVVRRTAGCTLFGHRGDEEILEGMGVEAVGGKLRRCKSNWL